MTGRGRARSLALNITGAVMALGIGLIAFLLLSNLREEPPLRSDEDWRPRLAVMPLVSGEHRRWLSGHGVVDSAQHLQVVAEVSGRIGAESPPWRSGDRVAAGELLLHIDDPSSIAAQANATAEISRLQAEQEQLRVQQHSEQLLLAIDEELVEILARILAAEEELLASGSSSQRTVDGRRQSLLQARSTLLARRQAVELFPSQKQRLQAQLAAAEARLAEAEAILATTQVYAPFAGVITAGSPTPGQAVSPGQEVLRLASDEREVRGQFRLQALQDLVPGQPLGQLRRDAAEEDDALPSATFRTSPKAPLLQGRLSRLEGSVDANLRLVEVVISLQAQEGLSDLPLGSFGALRLAGPTLHGQAFPRRAVAAGGLWLLDEDNRLRHWQGQWLELDAERFLIPPEAAPDPGSRLVLDPHPSLAEGQRVEPLEDAPGEGP